MSTNLYIVTPPRKRAVFVKAYSPKWAAQQGCTMTHSSAKWAWVRPVVYGRALRAERVTVYRGVGR